MYKFILVDIDNTLLDFNKCAKEAISIAFNEFGLFYKDDYFDIFVETNNDLWKALENNTITKEQLRNSRWTLIFEKCGIHEDGIKFEKRFEELIAESHIPVEGAIELLQYLSKKYDVYLVTNGFVKAQKNRISLAGMEPYIKDMFVSESIGYAKPSKEFFEHCISSIGNVTKEEMMIIGDSLSADIKGGIDFDIDTCWYNHVGEQKPEGLPINYTVTALNEIFHIL